MIIFSLECLDIYFSPEITLETDDDVINISAEQHFRIAIIDSIDILLTQMAWRYEQIMEISNDFDFLFGHSLTNTNTN